jgi:hypothetical protein
MSPKSAVPYRYFKEVLTMIRGKAFSAILTVVGFAALAGGGAFAAAPMADDPPAPPATAPGTDAPAGHHHNPAWAACKKQADDQKMQQGDARRDFMKNCMKSPPNTAPAPAAS